MDFWELVALGRGSRIDTLTFLYSNSEEDTLDDAVPERILRDIETFNSNRNSKIVFKYFRFIIINI